MQPIIVPTINSNDTDAILVSWVKHDGDTVSRGDTIAVLETTKASFDLAAEVDGVLQTAAVAGKRYEFGATIGRLFADATEHFAHAPSCVPVTAAATGEFVVTKAAQELIDRHGVSDAQLRTLGKTVIKAADVEILIPRPEEAGTIAPNAQQLTIARTVSRSRSTIPDAFLLKKVAVDGALGALAEFSREEKAMVALPDLLVWAVARLTAEFPFFFGSLREDLRFVPSRSGNIGVTFDVGSGLFIPVVRDAATRPLKEIAKQMMSFRMRALRNRFHAEELIGGDLSISLNTDSDILFVQPIILPPQTCMLSLGSVLDETVLSPEGVLGTRRFIQLGVAYDHRVINGYQANAFVNTIKSRIETPDRTAWR